MLIVIAPMLLLFSVGFAIIGLRSDFTPFALLSMPGLLLGIAGLIGGALRSLRDSHLRSAGIPVQTTPDHVKINTSLNLGKGSVVEVFCVGVAPAAFHGRAFRTGKFLDSANLARNLPSELTVFTDANHPGRYVIDLSRYGVSASRLPPLKTIFFPAALFALGIAFSFVGVWHRGTNGPTMRPVPATGSAEVKMLASPQVGQAAAWRLSPNACISGATQTPPFDGVTLRDDSTHGDNAITLIRDPAQGFLIDADIPGQNKDLRFFPGDCSGEGNDLQPMDSVVEGVRNFKGTLNANCVNRSGELHALIVFQLCH